jgi:hypothetical protein
MNTEELVLRDGRFIHRQTSISETPLGDASELLAKYIPKGVMSIGHLGHVQWGDTVISANLLVNGPKYLCYTILPSLKATLCYQPVFKPEYRDAYEARDKTLAKDILTKIEGWAFVAEATPTRLLGRKIKLDIPWNEARYGKLIFAIDGVFPGREAGILSRSGSPSVGQAYLGALKNSEIYTIRLTNHFDHGKICMGNDWDASKTRGSYIDNLQYALSSYITSGSNADLNDPAYYMLWSLGPDDNTPNWAKATPHGFTDYGSPVNMSILRATPTSITSFMGIT